MTSGLFSLPFLLITETSIIIRYLAGAHGKCCACSHQVWPIFSELPPRQAGKPATGADSFRHEKAVCSVYARHGDLSKGKIFNNILPMPLGRLSAKRTKLTMSLVSFRERHALT